MNLFNHRVSYVFFLLLSMLLGAGIILFFQKSTKKTNQDEGLIINVITNHGGNIGYNNQGTPTSVTFKEQLITPKCIICISLLETIEKLSFIECSYDKSSIDLMSNLNKIKVLQIESGSKTNEASRIISSLDSIATLSVRSAYDEELLSIVLKKRRIRYFYWGGLGQDIEKAKTILPSDSTLNVVFDP